MRKTKSIHQLVGITKKELNEYFDFLCESHQKFIKTHFDQNFKRKEEIIWTAKDISTYNHCIIKRLRNLKTRDLNAGYHSKMSLLKTLNISIEQLKDEIPFMRQDIQDFINTKFDANYNFSNSFDLWTEQEKVYYYHIFLRYLKLTFNNTPSNRQYLYDRIGIEKEIFEIIIALLPEKSQNIIKKYYSASFKPILNLEWDPKERLYFNHYTLIRIREIYNNKAKNYANGVYSNLLVRLNITSHQLNCIMQNINKEYQKFIYDRYDSSFLIKDNVILTENERKYIGSIIFPCIKKYIKKYGYDLINAENKRLNEINIIKNMLEETKNQLATYHLNLYNLNMKNKKEDNIANNPSYLNQIRLILNKKN